jgi:hypothetical protein
VSVVSLIVSLLLLQKLIVARPAPRNPWPDLGQTTAVYSLEWLLTSPMDFHTHSELPVIRIPTKKR